ncbi:MAG: hypothetical protein RIT81_19690 [Deltaproteobacteria bacterium]
MLLLAALTAMSAPAVPQPTAVVIRSVGAELEVDVAEVFDFVPSLDAAVPAEPVRLRVLACAGDLPCIVEATPDGFSRVVVAIVEARDDHIGVAVDVVETEEGRRLERHFSEIDPNTRTPRRAIVDELRAALDAAGHPAHGALRVERTPDDATVKVDDTPLDRPRVLLLPGPHRLEVAADDHETANLEVRILAGVETTQRVSLEPSGTSFWLWAGIGAAAVVAAAVTVAVVAAPRDSMTPLEFCQRPARGTPCGAAR